MRIKSLFMAFLAGALALVACKKEQNPNDLPPSITVTPGSVEFDQSEGSKKLEVNATRAWTVSGIPDWVAITPASGAASVKAAEVVISVLANSGNDREATLTFSIGLAKQAVTLKQKGAKGEIDNGKGTKESPYSVAGVIAYLNTLGADVNSPEKVYVKGKISKIADNGAYSQSGTYGNATFYISDGDPAGGEFYCYRILYLGNKKYTSGTDIKVGDEVIIYGNVVNFKGNTPETQQNSAFLYSLNGVTEGGDGPATGGDPKGSGTKEDPYNVAAAINAVKNLTWTANDNYQKVGPYYVKGKISRIADNGSFSQSGTFGNATFYISDDGTQNGEFYCYRLLYLGNKKYTSGTDIKVGDEVVIYGELMNYRGNTPETVSNSAHLYSLNGVTGGDDPGPGPGGEVQQITCAEFIQKADQNTVYRLVGEVTSDVNTSYCSFDMNDGTATVVVWTVNNKDEWKDVVKKGGTVTVRGKYQPYTDKNGNLKHEMVDAYIEDFKAGDTPGPGSDDKPSGNGTLDSPYNPKAAYDIAAALASDAKSDDVYITGKISSIKYTFSAEYGTATFNISEDGSTSGTQLPCYSVYYLGNRAWVNGDTQVAVGDKVIIYGKLTNYQGNTPETASKSAYIYSLNGSTGGDTPGPGPGPDPGDAIAVTVAEFIAAAESETQVYQLTGTIGGTINSTYGNFDLTDDSGTVYVYGLTATNLGYGASNDKSYASLGLVAGDKIVIKGYRGSYGEKVEVVYAWFVEKVSGGDPGPGPEPGGDFTSNVTWTAGSDNSYDQDATVNGTTGVKVLKLGKGSDYGKSTLTLPAGSTTLSFYAVSWNNADVANLVFSVNGQEVATVTPKANSGLAGNPTYTLTVSDSDHYTVDLGSATTTVEVKTAGGYRAALFGIIAK